MSPPPPLPVPLAAPVRPRPALPRRPEPRCPLAALRAAAPCPCGRPPLPRPGPARPRSSRAALRLRDKMAAVDSSIKKKSFFFSSLFQRPWRRGRGGDCALRHRARGTPPAPAPAAAGKARAAPERAELVLSCSAASSGRAASAPRNARPSPPRPPRSPRSDPAVARHRRGRPVPHGPPQRHRRRPKPAVLLRSAAAPLAVPSRSLRAVGPTHPRPVSPRCSPRPHAAALRAPLGPPRAAVRLRLLLPVRAVGAVPGCALRLPHGLQTAQRPQGRGRAVSSPSPRCARLPPAYPLCCPGGESPAAAPRALSEHPLQVWVKQPARSRGHTEGFLPAHPMCPVLCGTAVHQGCSQAPQPWRQAAEAPGFRNTCILSRQTSLVETGL